MATRESHLRGHDAETTVRGDATSEKLSLVVDHRAAEGLSLLILPFATGAGEEALGRWAAAMVQWRLHTVPELVVGHGLLVATGTEGRRYLPLYTPVSEAQACSCGATWHGRYVLSGSLTLRPALRWTLTLRQVDRKGAVFEDTLVGDQEDLLDAAGDVALTMINALSLSLSDSQTAAVETRDTDRLEALLACLEGLDLRPRHGLTQADPFAARARLLEALVLDPSFAAPVQALVEEVGAAASGEPVIDDLVARLEACGEQGAAALEVLARHLDQAGLRDQAGLAAGALLGLQPENVEALSLVGQQAYRAGNFVRARRLAQQLMDLAPERAAPYVLEGNLLAAANRVAGAALQWSVALRLEPDQPRLLLQVGSYLATTGDLPRARDLLRRADALGASTADSLYQLGVAAYRLGRNEEAIEALERGVAARPELPHVHIMLARCYMRAGRQDLAEQHDRAALALLPDYWPSALAVGYALLNRGEVEAAIQAYTVVVRARPDLPEALYGLGIALIAGNMPEDGLLVLRRARAIDPRHVPILCALGLAYLRLGLRREAEEAVAAAVALAPGSADVLHCQAKLAYAHA